MEKINLCDNPVIHDAMKEYLMGIFVCKSGGTLLYSFQIDPALNVHLISQFVAALQLFGAESVGMIKRINLEGINVEMNIVTDQDLILSAIFRPNAVPNKSLVYSAVLKALKMFRKEFSEPLAQGKINQTIYSRFDEYMYVLIHDYLIRVGKLDERDVCEHHKKYFILKSKLDASFSE